MRFRDSFESWLHELRGHTQTQSHKTMPLWGAKMQIAQMNCSCGKIWVL